MDTGEVLAKLVMDQPKHHIRACAIDARGRAIALVIAAESAWILDIATQEVLSDLRWRPDPAFQWQFDEKSAKLAIVTFEGVLLWDAHRGTRIGQFVAEGHRAHFVSMTGLGDRAATASMFDKTIRIWDVRRPWQITELRGHQKRLSCVAVSADGKLVVTGRR